MKIAIQANPSRGKEIISLLKSLGGGDTLLNGNGKSYTYYIGENNMILYNDAPEDYKVYTLEEFEKEFPFKVGDEVTIIGLPDFPKIITKMVWDCDEILYSFEGLNNTWFGAKSLKKFEMKKERNITLTLDKAKEWYNKGGELKEIALQAFSEKELNPLPRSWEEYCKNGNPILSFRYNISTKYESLYKLEWLVKCWRQGSVPKGCKYKIRKVDGTCKVICGPEDAFLSFYDKQTTEEFLECFRDLIEKAGDLI